MKELCPLDVQILLMQEMKSHCKKHLQWEDNNKRISNCDSCSRGNMCLSTLLWLQGLLSSLWTKIRIFTSWKWTQDCRYCWSFILNVYLEYQYLNSNQSFCPTLWTSSDLDATELFGGEVKQWMNEWMNE